MDHEQIRDSALKPAAHDFFALAIELFLFKSNTCTRIQMTPGVVCSAKPIGKTLLKINLKLRRGWKHTDVEPHATCSLVRLDDVENVARDLPVKDGVSTAGTRESKGRKRRTK